MITLLTALSYATLRVPETSYDARRETHRLDLFSFIFNDTATTEIYTLSLHDALPIYRPVRMQLRQQRPQPVALCSLRAQLDRKSTRLNSSHLVISYAVFCLKKNN